MTHLLAALSTVHAWLTADPTHLRQMREATERTTAANAKDRGLLRVLAATSPRGAHR